MSKATHYISGEAVLTSDGVPVQIWEGYLNRKHAEQRIESLREKDPCADLKIIEERDSECHAQRK